MCAFSAINMIKKSIKAILMRCTVEMTNVYQKLNLFTRIISSVIQEIFQYLVLANKETL